MSWIKIISYTEAGPFLKKMYDRVKGPDNNVDNVLTIHSLRPHSLKGHMGLYKAVLHNVNNTLPKWYLECIGVYVSYLNQCDYCVQHHFTGLKRLWNDDEKATKFLDAMKSENFDQLFDAQLKSGFPYARQITLSIHSVQEKDVKQLKSAGFTDGEILELNQLISYFNYVNRTVIGLGVNTDGDILGLSPNESADPDDWRHK